MADTTSTQGLENEIEVVQELWSRTAYERHYAYKP